MHIDYMADEIQKTLYYLYSHEIVSLGSIIVACVIGIFIQAAITFYGFKILKPKIAQKECM